MHKNQSHVIVWVVATVYCITDTTDMVLIFYIGRVIVNVLALRAVARGFESQSIQIEDHEIRIFCFTATHSVLGRKNKDCGSESG